MNKKIFVVLVILSLISVSSVFAENVVFKNLDGENYIKLSISNHESRKLELENPNYVISAATYSPVISSGSDYIGTIKAKKMGLGEIQLSIRDQDFNQIASKKIIVDVDTDKMMDSLIKKIPDVHYGSSSYLDRDNLQKFLEPVLHFNGASYELINDVRYELSNCQRNSEGETCTFTLSTHNQYFRSKTVTFKTVYPNIFLDYNPLDVNETTKLILDNAENINLDDFIYFSKDNSIATIDENGNVLGVSPGQTDIVFYNKKTNEYITQEITINPPYEEVYNFFKKYDNTTIDIDIGEFDNYLDYRSVYLVEYFNKLIESNNWNYSMFINTEYSEPVKCIDNVCSVEITYGCDNKMITIENVKYNIHGFMLNELWGQVGDTEDLKKLIKTAEIIKNVEIEVDPNYFKYDDSSKEYLPIKVGTTEIKFTITNDQGEVFKKSTFAYIALDNFSRNILLKYIDDISTYELPFKESDLNGNYEILEKYIINFVREDIISKHILKEDTLKAMKIETKCIDFNACNVNFSLDDLGNFAPHMGIDEKTFNIAYSEESDAGIDTLSKAVNKLKDRYVLSRDDTVRLKNNSKTNEDFYNHLIDYTDINDIIKELGSYQVSLENMRDEKLTSGMPGSRTLELVIKKDSKILFRKEIIIKPNHILDASSLVEQDLDTKIDAIKRYMKKTIDDDVEVTNTYLNIFHIKTSTNEFECIYANNNRNVEGSTISNIKFGSNIYNVRINSSIKTKAILEYTDELDDMSISYSSSDENIFTVDSNGNLTGKNIGEGVLTATSSNGLATTTKVVVGDYVKGDLDGNGTISIKDAIEVLYYVVGKYGEPSAKILAVGDMNEDGKITIGDAIAILKLYIG